MSRKLEEQLERLPPGAAAGAAWTGVLGGPLAWFASQQVGYALVPWACHGGSLLAIHLVNLAGLLVVILAGAMAWHDWRRPGRHVSDEGAPPEGRRRFLGLAGLMLCLLFGLAIVAQAIGAFVFEPCQT
jgi:hypothetical protein